MPHSIPPIELNTPKAMVVMPYVKHLSESIRRILSLLKTCFRPHRTLRQALVNLNDRIPFQHKAGVIYRIPCNGCPRVYVGQTGRRLAQRLKEHKWALVSGHLAQSEEINSWIMHLRKRCRRTTVAEAPLPERCCPRAGAEKPAKGRFLC